MAFATSGPASSATTVNPKSIPATAKKRAVSAPHGGTKAKRAPGGTPTIREGTKQAQLIAMLKAPDGATIEQAALRGYRQRTVMPSYGMFSLKTTSIGKRGTLARGSKPPLAFEKHWMALRTIASGL